MGVRTRGRAHTQVEWCKAVMCWFVYGLYGERVLVVALLYRVVPRLRAGPLKTRDGQKRSIVACFVDNATSGIAPPPRDLHLLWSIEMGPNARGVDTPSTTRGRVPVKKARSGGRPLKQERFPELRSGDVSVVRTRGCWPSCAQYTMTSSSPTYSREDHLDNEGVLHAACGRSRAPDVMTTTLRAT